MRFVPRNDARPGHRDDPRARARARGTRSPAGAMAARDGRCPRLPASSVVASLRSVGLTGEAGKVESRAAANLQEAMVRRGLVGVGLRPDGELVEPAMRTLETSAALGAGTRGLAPIAVRFHGLARMGTSTQPVPPRLGPYELLQRIATGGMAEVYLARREGPHGFQKIVAVKRILPQLARDPDFTAMFVDEARVCAHLGHPNIVQVFDFGEHNGELYMAMELVDGTTGARLIRAAAAKDEEIPLDVSLHIALSVLRGLEYAHNARDEEGRPLSLVHRDVSPGNVLIDRSGAVKLTDFGIARATEVEPRTEAGQLKGKLGYMSPEQVVGRPLDARSDLFTLGIVFAELVMLRPLFAGGTELDVLMRIRDADLTALDRSSARVPDDVKAVLYRALTKDPLLRYPSAAAFAEAIEELVRRRRLQVGPAKLAACIEKLGLISNDGEFELDEDTDERISTEVLSLSADTQHALHSSPPSQGPERDVSPQIYRVKQPDGMVMGPMSYPRLVELFVTGRVKTKALIARESAEYKASAGVSRSCSAFRDEPGAPVGQ